MKQIINILDYEEHKISFRDYLGSLGAEIREATNIYEAARFYLKGKTCVVYYKESKGRFSYSNEFSKSIHEEWKRGGKVGKILGPGKDYEELNKVKKEVYKILGDLKEDPEFVRHINKEFDGNFDIERFHFVNELRTAYKCIKQYRELFKKKLENG